MSNRPDEETSLTLMMRVQRDAADPAAWNEFVHRYQPMIRAWCLKWGAQCFDAEDVAQQVLIKLLTAMKTYQCESPASFRGWLKTVTRNAWIDFTRRPCTRQARTGLLPSLIRTTRWTTWSTRWSRPTSASCSNLPRGSKPG